MNDELENILETLFDEILDSTNAILQLNSSLIENFIDNPKNNYDGRKFQITLIQSLFCSSMVGFANRYVKKEGKKEFINNIIGKVKKTLLKNLVPEKL